MWIRSELKALGKQDFKRDYWCYVLVAFLALLATGTFPLKIQWHFDFSDMDFSNIVQYVSNTSRGNGIIGILLTVFLLHPLYVGTRRFFLSNIYKDEKTSLGTVLYAFDHSYGNVVLTTFLKSLFIALWSLLLVIPGIVKMYSYFMVDYILADNPGLDQARAFEISKKTMVNEKMNVFIFDLSFILWYLLSGITLGIVGIFYVVPYVEASKARLYDCLKQKALSNGFATYEDFNC